jgi:hypothetical protein
MRFRTFDTIKENTDRLLQRNPIIFQPLGGNTITEIGSVLISYGPHLVGLITILRERGSSVAMMLPLTTTETQEN